MVTWSSMNLMKVVNSLKKTGIYILVLMLSLGTTYPIFAVDPANLIIEDNAQLFSSKAKDKAKEMIDSVKKERVTTVRVLTFDKLSESELSEFEKVKNDDSAKKKFWDKWSKDKIGHMPGINVIICAKPGHIHTLTDKQAYDKDFTSDKENKLRDLFLNAFKQASGKTGEEKIALQDKGLIDGATYLQTALPKATKRDVAAKGGQKAALNAAGGGWTGYLCMGLLVLMGVWLVIGIFRALAGAGRPSYGPGYGPPGGPGYGPGGGYGGGGGGGGGFMSGLMGGLFGSMAGMWMYNNLFGNHSSGMNSAFGSDNYGANNYNNNVDDNRGAGDYSDTNGSGGDFDDGGSSSSGSGGDWSGGGSDFSGGGGGDYGGGWSGGGGDFGGGGGGDFGGGDGGGGDF